MTSGHLLVLGGSILWMLLCMRFWYAIDREHTWQRRFIAIGAGIGGGLIYLVGTMMLEMLKDHTPPEPPGGAEIRVSAPPPPVEDPKKTKP
ncbi:MAG: hypothetical protein ACKVY0_07390 [Prosthecobacter sp.]|uniref:hypothetical protein n=1 Tax=Prosthecobacter sp. TaxID=1965333 RepID=UPI0038FFAC15